MHSHFLPLFLRLPRRPSLRLRHAFRRLTPAEQLERRRQGLCFNCDEPYMPGHVCPRLFYLGAADYIEEDAAAAGLGDLPAPAAAEVFGDG